MSWKLPPSAIALLDGPFPLPLDRPFSSRDVEQAGVSRHTLLRLVELGLVRRVVKGVYVAAQVPDDLLLRTRALALLAPDDAAAVDWTACWLHTGMLPPGDHLRVPPVSFYRFAGRGRMRSQLANSGERSFDEDDLMFVEGLPVTTPLRTALDLGRFAHRDWAMASIDALLRLRRFTQGTLLDNVERFRRQRGVVQLRELAPLGDARAESAGESVLRLRWHDCSSLPSPVPQISIAGPGGRELYRLDLGVEALLFAAEYDGERHHSSAEDQARDRLRRRVLTEEYGWIVKPVTKANVFGIDRDIERILHEGIRQARRRLGGHGSIA